MKSLRNKVQLIGNLGKDAEIKHLDSGKMVATVTMATSESYNNASGKKVTDTQWHNLVVWGKGAELLEKYTQKGSEIAVEGRLVSRVYEDKAGIKRTISEIVVNDILLLKSSKAETQSA